MTSPFRVALAHFGDLDIGPVHHRNLLATLGDDEAVWGVSESELMRGGLSPTMAAKFVAWRNAHNPQALADDVATRGIDVVGVDDDRYPTLLKAIHDPPYVLFYRGTLPPHDAMTLGVVGSRKATDYGLRVAHDMSRDLASRGIVIVSGLAWGIDEAAHRATLDAGGVTIAVLASGLDGQDAPRKDALARAIVDAGGCVMSEFPPTMPPLTHHFPIRNRVIAGLSKATLVVEAAEQSGSLITARAALNENRELFAVPGPITSPTSVGTNRLCRDGAHVATCADDILSVLGVTDDRRGAVTPPMRTGSPASPEAAAIYAVLTMEPLHIDDICRAVGLPTPLVGSTLTVMEIEGWARHIGGSRYIR
ncbi:DNA-protecting protein DprA [Candidatus Uhrbacteria bacterium]|nr:DNA-protecting protein DprA [Candidatus Uhrbacteria bacterium]